jgi:hypothetical protein
MTVAPAAQAATSGPVTLVPWGDDSVPQRAVPTGLSDVVSIAAGGDQGLVLKTDGTVVAWGGDAGSAFGVCSGGPGCMPAGLDNVTAISAGAYHSLALKADGTVAAWGNDEWGQTDVPAGLAGVTAISAGHRHNLAVRSDGTVTGWGDNSQGELDIPAGLSNVVAVAAGAGQSMALRSDGTVVAWGANNYGEGSVPAGLGQVTAIAAGSGGPSVYDGFDLALKSDGTVVAWGNDSVGQTDVPAGLDHVVAISAGWGNALALKSDGTVVAWGSDGGVGWTSVPAGLDHVTAIAAGGGDAIAMVSDDTTPPATTISCNAAACGSTPYTGPVTVSLAAADPGGSGAAKTVYTTDGSDPAASSTATTYTGPFTITQTTTIRYYSVDGAGNAEPTQSAYIQISAGPAYTSLVDGRPSLIAHWRLGEKSGPTAWDTAGAYNGSYTGSPTLGVPGAVTNDPDTAAGFNGSASKVSVPAIPAVTDFTVEGWSDLAGSAATNNTVFGGAGSVRILARPGSPGTPTAAYAGVWLNGTEYVLQPKSTASNLNTWVHWVLTRQGNVLTLYRDGVQIGQRTDLPATATASLNGAIGMQANGNYPLTGRIDEVALYSSALSAADVAADYQAALSGPPPPPPSIPSYKSAVLGGPSLISYWRLGEASGTAAADSKGTNNGTYSGVSLGLPGAITNDPDTAAGFNGSTSKVSLPSLGTAGGFTIEGWTYLTSSSTTNNTLYGSSGAVRLLIRPGSATAAYAGVWLNGTEYVLQPNSPASNINTWVYWVLTRQGNVLTLYRDGVQIGQRTDLPATAAATITGSIGAQGGSTYFLTGRIDDVAIYNAALSSAAITSHYNAALNGSPPP